jgi:hypothetical protein
MTTFLVEDGTGLADATSYASIASANAFHSARLTSRDLWFGLNVTEQQAALVDATAALDAGHTWRGLRLKNFQALGHPRQLIQDDDGRTISTLTALARVAEATAFLAARIAGQEFTERRVVSRRLGQWAETYADGDDIDLAGLAPLLAGLYFRSSLVAGLTGARVERWS